MTENNTSSNTHRSHCISIRLNNGEVSLLNEKRGSHRKGEWLRMAFLHNLPSAILSINLDS